MKTKPICRRQFLSGKIIKEFDVIVFSNIYSIKWTIHVIDIQECAILPIYQIEEQKRICDIERGDRFMTVTGIGYTNAAGSANLADEDIIIKRYVYKDGKGQETAYHLKLFTVVCGFLYNTGRFGHLRGDKKPAKETGFCLYVLTG